MTARSDADREASLAYRVYDLAIGEDDARLCRDIPESQCREQPHNFVAQTTAQVLSKTGDALADAKIILPWLLGALGAPVLVIGFLVPVRESLALLPQVLVGGAIRRFAVRKGFWVAASVVEGLCILAMAGVAFAGAPGAVAGWAVVGLLTLFSLARGVASIAAKDTLGKTVSKGRRGRVNGYSASISGLAAGAVGIYLVATPEAARPDWLLYALIAVAGLCWLAAAAVFATTKEYAGATDGGRSLSDMARGQLALLFADADLRRFLVARTLLISTALAGPVYVGLAREAAGGSLDKLGWLVVAAGLAGALSSHAWGKLADRSSRATMALAAAIAGVLGLLTLAVLHLAPVLSGHIGFFAGVIFVLAIAHAGVRIGRKTHIVDMAPGDRKAEYVAISNTLIGVMLLVLGIAAGALMAIGLELAIAVLSLLALVGAAVTLSLRSVQD